MAGNSNKNKGFGQRNTVRGSSAVQRRGNLAGSQIRDRGGNRFGEQVAKEEAIAPKIFFYNKRFAFWSMIVIFTLFFGYLIIDEGVYTFDAIWPKIATWAASLGISFLALKFGMLNDKPETDLRAFFVKGPWFRMGALFAAGFFIWKFGYEWIWSYDLTNTSMGKFGFGMTTMNNIEDQEAAVGLAGFLEKLAGFIQYALAGGIVVASIANRLGLNTADTTNNDGGIE